MCAQLGILNVRRYVCLAIAAEKEILNFCIFTICTSLANGVLLDWYLFILLTSSDELIGLSTLELSSK